MVRGASQGCGGRRGGAEMPRYFKRKWPSWSRVARGRRGPARTCPLRGPAPNGTVDDGEGTPAAALPLPARRPLRHGAPRRAPGFCRRRPLTLELAATRFPRAAFEVMLPAVLLSIVLLGFRMARRPISRFLVFLIVLGAGYVVLVNGLIWTHRAAAAVEPAVAAPAAARYLPTKSFTAVGTRRVARLAVKGDRLERVLVLDAAAKAPRFTLYRSGALSVRGEHGQPGALGGEAARAARRPRAGRGVALRRRPVHGAVPP